ncbi:uncharacterized protein N7482_003626 [Penicillium canariense]|uniref:NADH-cytochrome b5 reductase 1 n=1 Tax=Penicillium canariense TaxID=189055 RepID=A0A9W9IAR7_9EURO|nr:uncharacterized protein N7482_003626 [Penicillium canariense]KAJ5168032.1 hypothetical protein N7482_003626 [Penicillium canariense]
MSQNDTTDNEVITRGAVARHATKNDLWVILHNKVYNITPYLEEHPGGVAILVESAGQDTTEAFEDIGHSTDAREVLEKYLVGRLPDNERSETTTTGAADITLTPRETFAHKEDAASKKKAASKKQLQALASAISIGLFFITGIIFLGTRSSKGLFALDKAGGFWAGFCISSVASAFMAVAATFWFSSLFKGKKKLPFPAHIKAGPVIARRRAINSGFLNPREFKSFPLVEKHKISPDTFRFVFGLPEAGSILGLPTGQHVYIRHENDKGEMVSRSYTPVSSNRERGRMELVVKTYPNGFMSQYLANLAIGDKADFRGPGGKMKYTRYLTREMGMIAGGSGITPMFSIIKAVCTNEKDNTKLSVLFANRTEKDILLREELDDYARTFPHKFKIWYVLDSPPDGWQYGSGHINKQLIQERLPAQNGEESKILLCGPPGMQKAITNTLVELGFHRPTAVAHVTDEVFVF